MGGISKYRDAFFTADFIENNTESSSYVIKLRSLIFDQVFIHKHRKNNDVRNKEFSK